MDSSSGEDSPMSTCSGMDWESDTLTPCPSGGGTLFGQGSLRSSSEEEEVRCDLLDRTGSMSGKSGSDVSVSVGFSLICLSWAIKVTSS